MVVDLRLLGLLKAGMKPYPQTSYEELVSEGYAVVGSPQTVTERFVELQEQLGFGQLITLMGIGDISHERTVHSMDLFAAQVMPELRKLGAPAPD